MIQGVMAPHGTGGDRNESCSAEDLSVFFAS